MLKTYLVVMVGGAVGTGLRMALSGLIAARWGETFPVGTLVVNVTGCFVIGLVAALSGIEGHFLNAPLARQGIMIGVLGGFTTFSAFGLHTFDLLNQGDWMRAALNALLSVVLCLVAVWAGYTVATAFQR